MSEFFRSAHDPAWNARLNSRIPSVEGFPGRDGSDRMPNQSGAPGEPRKRFASSRLLMFAEMALTREQDGVTARFCALDNEPNGYDSVLYASVKWAAQYEGASGGSKIALPPAKLHEAVGMIHGSHGNAVFVDGHVDTLTAEQTWWAVNGRGIEELKEEITQN